MPSLGICGTTLHACPRLRRGTTLFLLGMLAAGPAYSQAQAVTAFVNVSVVPLDEERVLAEQTVVVRGDRIVAMGPTNRVEAPAEATRIDGRGKFLMPGLADMHAHVPGGKRVWKWIDGLMQSENSPANGNDIEDPLAGDGMAEAQRMLFLWLANGITTVRVMYSYGSPQMLVLRDQAAKGTILSPRIYAAAGPVDPVPGMKVPPDSAVRLVTAAKAAGYDLVKLHGIGGETFDSAVAVAHRLGIPIAGHVPEDSGGLERAIQAGYASIEHLTGLREVKDTAKLGAFARAIQRAGIWNCPTLINNTTYALPPTPEAPELQYYSDSARPESRAEHSVSEINKEGNTIEALNTIIHALHKAGAGLLLGTDAPLNTPGFSVHRELEAFVRAGLTPYEALLTGTRNVAAYFHTLDSAGTVAVGKRADLVLLAGNPLDDIRHTAQPVGVMIGGRWLSRAELDQRLAPLKGTLYH